MDRDKRQIRKMKRDLKRAGNKRRRQYLKRQLADNPAEAAHPEFNFGDLRSATWNGIDRDITRWRKEKRGE
jgi:hypothetical protein